MTMRGLGRRPLASLAILVASSAGCAAGSTGLDGADSGGTSGGDSPGAGGSQPGAGGAGGSTTPTGVGTDPTLSVPTGDAGAAGAFQGCAAVEELAELTPVNLIILYDSSGSMGDNEATGILNLERRWNPAKAGMKSFFQAPGSPGIYASLKFFPHSGGFEATCNPDNYSYPDVSLRSLEDPSALVTALENREPGGGTPMLPALMGAMDYAASKILEDPQAETVVVMVTDGEPAVIPSDSTSVDPECPAGQQNTVAGVAEFVSAKYRSSPSIPTYVIGIGSGTSDLGQIADMGGTEMVAIDDANPELVQAQLAAAFEGIRERSFDCTIDFPALPVDQSVGFVNVDFAASNGTTTEFVKATTSCSSLGWTLDNEDDPQVIQLCPQACESVQTDPDGQLRITIGCATRVDAI